MSWLKEQMARLREFLRGDFRRVLLGCVFGMLGAVLLGVVIGILFPAQAAQVLANFMAQIADSGVISEEGEMSVFALLMNNWRAMLISAAYGFIPFLFLPLISLVINGGMLGLLAAVFQAEGGSLAAYFAGILPHGIFELPALIFSIACGVALCGNMCRLVTSSPRRIPMAELLEDLLRVIVLVVAPLTVGAAFIECYVTPVVMGFFM